MEHVVKKLGVTENSEVVLYKSLFWELFPDAKILFVEVDPEASLGEKASFLSLPHGGLSLAGGTSSRKRGILMYADQETVQGLRTYFGTPERLLAYTSNLFSSCWEGVETKEMTMLVVPDGEYGTGDCHAKVSSDLSSKAATFRLAWDDRFLAKGTFAPSDEVPDGVDVVIPFSAFKSDGVPCMGAHIAQATLGILSYAKTWNTKLSYQVLVHFPIGVLSSDLKDRMTERALDLKKAGRDMRYLIELMKLDRSEGFRETLFYKVVSSDVGHKLAGHPWLIRRAKELLARQWKELALGGGVKVPAPLTIPDESLGDNVVSCPNLPEGKYVMFRYPLVSVRDIIIVHNVHGNPHENTVAMNPATAEKCRGDFDGDHNVLLPAEEFPAMVKHIESLHTDGWENAEEHLAQKVRSESDWDELPIVCAEQSESAIGLTSFALTSAIANGRGDLVAKLEVVLQDEVDALKYDLDPDVGVVHAALDELDPPGWLLDRNAKEAFRDREMQITSSRDSITAMVNYINGLWEPPEYRASRACCYKNVFNETKRSVLLAEDAKRTRREYAEDIGWALESKDSDEALSIVIKKWKMWGESLEHKADWATALWRETHKTREGVASFTFLVFPDQVVERLGQFEEANEFTVVGLNGGEFGEEQLRYLNGSKRSFNLYETTLYGVPRIGVKVQNHRLGVVIVEDHVNRLPKKGRLRFQWNGNGVVKAW